MTNKSRGPGADLTLDRTYYADSTIGRVRSPHFDRLVWLLELPWRNNARRISCVKPGRYRYRVGHSPRAGRGVIWLEDKHGRENVQWHPGNSIDDIVGCGLPCFELGSDDRGRPRAQAPTVAALEYLIDHIPGEGVLSIIENAGKPGRGVYADTES